MKPKSVSSKLLYKFAFWSIVSVVIYFFSDTLINSWNAIDKKSLFENIPLSSVSMIFFMLAVVLSGYFWGKILSKISNHKILPQEAIRVHLLSWLLKYVPGQVGALINKVRWSSDQGISKKNTFNSFIYENIFTVIAGMVLSLPLLLSASGVSTASYIPLAVGGLSLIALCVSRPVFHFLFNTLMQVLKRDKVKKENFLNFKELSLFSVLYTLPRLLTGFGFVFIAASFIDLSFESAIMLASTYIFAGIVGLMAIFVPGGIGVREAVIVFFASQYMGIEKAVVLSLIARLFSTLADVGVFLIYFIMKKRNNR